MTWAMRWFAVGVMWGGALITIFEWPPYVSTLVGFVVWLLAWGWEIVSKRQV